MITRKEMTCPMKWLHLSDIHFMGMEYNTKKLRNALLAKLDDISPNLDFIIITGDCFYQNDSSKDIVPEMRDFIKEIASLCHLNIGKVHICQGNHDLDRSNSDRNKLVEDVRTRGTLTASDYDKLVKLGNENFRSLFRALKRGKEYKDYDIIEPKNLDVRIVSINSCLLSKDDNDYHNLRVCTPILEDMKDKIKNDGKLNLVIMHHGIDWLAEDDGKKFEHWIEDRYIDAVFVGHTHQPNVSSLNDVNRDIYQFTSGALMLDGHAIPSFFMCEEVEGKLTVTLYSYSDKTDSWEIDNHNLRKFKNNGRHAFYIPKRFTKNANNPTSYSDLSCEELVRSLNDAYENKYGTRRFFSDKTAELEDFNAWKIIGSLAGIGLPYPVALKLSITVVRRITSEEFPCDNLVHSSTLKRIIHESILNCHHFYPEIDEYDIGIWANRYTRHYDKDVGSILVDGNKEDPISYSLLKSEILKEVVVGITDNEVYFKKISTSDLEKMSSEIMKFVKSLGISRIRKNVLLDIISEYVSEPPHSWFVNNNRDELLEHHKEETNSYLQKLDSSDEKNPALQVGAAYHIFAAYLTIYDKYIGCTDIAPIKILKTSLGQVGTKSNDNLPMRRCMLVQLIEDLKKSDISFENFKENVDIVYKNIVVNKNVTDEKTVKALIKLRSILSKIEIRPKEKWTNTGDAYADIRKIFENAEGFKVRSTMQQFPDIAFVVAPYWDDHQRRRYNLGDDMLVCMLKEDKTLDLLCQYLSQARKHIIQELVLFKPDVSGFTPEERRDIREKLKQSDINVRCIFIQEPNFKYIESVGWRKSLFDVVRASKNSIY